MIEYDDLIGKPYVYGGRGPDEYDCWGIVMEMYRRRGITIPDYERPETLMGITHLMQQEVQLWTPCSPAEGVAMYIRMSGHPHHVGVYLGMNKFIHTYEGPNVVCIDRADIWKRRIVGYYDFNQSAD